MKERYRRVWRVVCAGACSVLLLACQANGLSSTQVPAQSQGAAAPTPMPLHSIYRSPQASAKNVTPATSIAIRYAPDILVNQLQPELFVVRGEKSGLHRGRIVLSDDQKTILFKPTDPFTPGERVDVSFAGGALGAGGEQLEHDTLAFRVTPNPNPSVVTTASGLSDAAAQKPAASQAAPAGRYVTAPGTLPWVTVTHYLTHTTGDSIFLNTSSKQATQYLMILTENGELVYYKELQNGVAYTDFTQQPNGLLTYFEGMSTPDGGGTGVYRALDSSYQVVDSYPAGNGYVADSHELRILPNGHALFTIYDYQIEDMSAYGGKPQAKFIDLLVQELDRARNVVFEWKASEHVPFTDTYESLTGDTVDPYHGNAIEVFPDGNLLVSFRHLSQVVKVDRQTGDVIWRMGGKHSDFKFVNDVGFSYLHDIRLLPNGNITVFDNGNQHKPQASRAVEYALDETARTATRVWAYQHEPAIYGSYMGNTQRLSDGNTFIGWGGPRPIASEVTPDGQLVRDIEVDSTAGIVYRWFKLPWKGQPDTAPTLVAQTDGLTTTLYYSWNGATEVAAYRIEAGRMPDLFAPLKTETRQGFETATALVGAAAQSCYYRVVAIDKAGAEMRSSNVVMSTTRGCP